MKTITVELSDEVVADIERSAQRENRSPSNWLDTFLLREFYGCARLIPEPYASMEFPRVRRERITTVLRRQVYAKSGSVCAYCKTKVDAVLGWDVDHMLPISMGGTNHPDNLCLACHSCNCRKGTKTADEFRKEILQ